MNKESLPLPPSGTYVKFKKKFEIAKKGQMGRISEDGKSVGIWYCGWPVFMNGVDGAILETISEPKKENAKEKIG